MMEQETRTPLHNAFHLHSHPILRRVHDAPMNALPFRNTLTDQTAALIRHTVEAGAWTDWLPSERTLVEQFQIGRNTLRRALHQLEKEELIRPQQGVGYAVLRRPLKRKIIEGSRDVGLLSPDPLTRMPPNQILWIDELRSLLAERGCRLHLFHGKQYFAAQPEAALKQLTNQRRHGCWVLVLSNLALQRWFERNQVPCVVAGSVAPDVRLPFRDHDQRAVCRHAAGVLLARGYRRLALVITRSDRAGDLESAAGFTEGALRSGHREAVAEVCWHDGTQAGICNSVRRLFARRDHSTGLLVANGFHYLTVMGTLQQIGLRIPEQVGVISRDSEAYMDHLVPAPTRYEAKPRQFAKSLLEVVSQQVEGAKISRPHLQIMPQLVRGCTAQPA